MAGGAVLGRSGIGAAAAALVAACLLPGCAGDAPTVVEDPCRSASVAYPAPTQTGDTRHVHDPEAVRWGGAYYVFSTNDGVPIRRSTDLRYWRFLGRVFPQQLPSWAAGEVPGVEAPWAPGLAHFDGRWHLYYSLSTFGSQRSVIGLATNATLDPAAPGYAWQDRGKVVESRPGYEHNAIDPAVVEDVTGGLWLVWGSWSGGIMLHALDRESGRFATADTVTRVLARRPGVRAIEGPYIVRRGGRYYLFASFDLCCRGVESTYNVRVGRSDAVTGPYLDRDGMPMLEGGGSLVLEGYGRVRGPGHASVLEDGGEYLLVHHYYDAEDGGTPHLQVRPLVWDADGWPLAGEAYAGQPSGPPPAGSSPVGRWGYWAGAEGARSIEVLAGGVARACDRDGSWTYQAPALIVTWGGAGGTGGGRVDRTILTAGGESLVGRTSDGRIVRGYRLSR